MQRWSVINVPLFIVSSQLYNTPRKSDVFGRINYLFYLEALSMFIISVLPFVSLYSENEIEIEDKTL